MSDCQIDLSQTTHRLIQADARALDFIPDGSVHLVVTSPPYWILNKVQNGTKFLGKPYEPNAIIRNDIEFISMQRKPGAYRNPTPEQRQLSKIDKKDYEAWFRQMWDIPGASTASTLPRSLTNWRTGWCACSRSMAIRCLIHSMAQAPRCWPR